MMPVVETADAERASAAARKPADTAASETKQAITQEALAAQETRSTISSAPIYFTPSFSHWQQIRNWKINFHLKEQLLPETFTTRGK